MLVSSFIFDIRDFDTPDVSQKIVDAIKKIFDKEDRFKLYIRGCYEDPTEAVDVCDKDADDISYKGLIHHVSKLHILYKKFKEDDLLP